MKNADIVIVGGSAAGVPTAITARRHNPDKSILLIRKEKQVLIPCGIPYIFGTVGEPENNLIPDTPLTGNNVDLLVDKVTEIDKEKKCLRTAGGETIEYDKLILATGSEPVKPPIPGINKKNVFTVKKDVDYLKEFQKVLDNTEDLVILGGGFIGVEFADECKKGRKINVTVVEMLDQCLQMAFAEEECKCCKKIEDGLKKKGINIITGTKLEEILGEDKISAVKLSNGNEIKADALIVGIGVKPNINLAKKSGIEADPSFGIKVDSNQRTSDPNIFAVGDCASKVSFFTGKPSRLWLASIATNEARIAGANLYDTRRTNQGVIGVFSTAIDKLTVGKAGMSAKEALECGFDVAVGEMEAPNRHPGGMPGMSKMWVKLNFNKSNGEIIGGSVCGGPSAGEVVNTISACIQKRMTADDIATFQIGTHPAVTASPIAYQMVNAAEMALKDMR